MDLDFIAIITNIFNQSSSLVVLDIYAIVGWIVLVAVFFTAGLKTLAMYKLLRYTSGRKKVLLAIDIPPMNVQTPKAVEQLFTHIFSVMEPPSIGNTYRRGFKQHYFSFEIISIEGYIQFIIRTLDKYRDVVESAVYAQYPDAEITEVEDYVSSVPDNYPNDTHDMWAADYVLTQDQAYPIRTYEEFEHTISKDTVFKDPMSAILESFSRIGPGEQVWFQMIIAPLEEWRWKEDAIKKIKELIGEKEEKKSNIFGKFFGGFASVGKVITDELDWQLTSVEGAPGGPDSGRDDGPKNEILYLTPGQKKILEAMENKIRKLAFKTKIRLVYVARKEVFKPSRTVNSFTGALNLFNIPSSNGLLPKYLTSVEYFFKDYRQNYRKNLLMYAYKKRNKNIGKKSYVLNIEELATIWHFPMSYVKVPLVQTAQAKVSEPPSGLPVEAVADLFETETPKLKVKEKESGYTTDAGYVSGDDEVKFG